MWFNNALIYQYEFKEPVDLTTELTPHLLKPCPPHARFVYGFLPVLESLLVHEINGAALLCLGKEERILPRSVIQRFLLERVKAIEEQQQRQIKRIERAQLAEEIEFDLLPKSFCIQKQLLALFDTLNNRLVVNTASQAQGTQLVSSLRKAIPSLQIEPIFIQNNLALRLAQWISDPSSLPAPFQLASDCLLFSLNDEKKRVNCKGYELPAEEVLTLLSQGLAAAEISLIWQDRIQFTLTHELTLKRIKSLDYLADEFTQIRDLEDENLQQDAALTLLNGELRALIHDLEMHLAPNPKDSDHARQAEESEMLPS